MSRLPRLRRATSAAAAPPKRISIGGAGTSIGGPPVDVLVLDEPEVDEEVELEVDVELEVELDVELDVDELPLVPVDVDGPPVEVEVDDPPVDVEDPPVDVDDPPVEVDPPLEDEVDEITIPPLPLLPPQKPPLPPKNVPPQPPLLPTGKLAGVATAPPLIGMSAGAGVFAAMVMTPGVQVVVVVTVRTGLRSGALRIAGAAILCGTARGCGCSA